MRGCFREPEQFDASKWYSLKGIKSKTKPKTEQEQTYLLLCVEEVLYFYHTIFRLLIWKDRKTLCLTEVCRVVVGYYKSQIPGFDPGRRNNPCKEI